MQKKTKLGMQIGIVQHQCLSFLHSVIFLLLLFFFKLHFIEKPLECDVKSSRKCRKVTTLVCYRKVPHMINFPGGTLGYLGKVQKSRNGL